MSYDSGQSQGFGMTFERNRRMSQKGQSCSSPAPANLQTERRCIVVTLSFYDKHIAFSVHMDVCFSALPKDLNYRLSVWIIQCNKVLVTFDSPRCRLLVLLSHGWVVKTQLFNSRCVLINDPIWVGNCSIDMTVPFPFHFWLTLRKFMQAVSITADWSSVATQPRN